MMDSAFRPISSADIERLQVSQPESGLSAEHELAIPTPPSLAGNYQFIRQLGQGSQAKVFLARRLSDNQMVAIKQLNIESVSSWKEYDLFHREVEVLSSLDIDGVARFYEAIECLEDNPPCSYLVQEYIEGESLGSMLRAGHRFAIAEVYDIILQMLRILYQLQNRPDPVVHRDIKPSNIMLTPAADGYVVSLIDFGAVANPQVQSGGSTVAGTYGYMPPEQLMGRPQPASDIYSLAAVAVELFSGKSPAMMPTRDFRLIFEPDVESQPPVLVATLRQMLEPDVKKRLCDIEQLRKRFSNYQNGVFKNADVRTKKDKLYQNQLQAVNGIGEPGNIDLWQKLPDTILRDVPEIFDTEPEEMTELSLRSNDQLISESVTKFSVISIIVFIGIYIIFVSGLSPLLALGLFAAFFMVAMHVVPSFNSVQIPEKQSLSDENDKLRVMRRQLLMNGRKTIATIVSIEYVPQQEEDCIYFQNADVFGVDGDPKFRVQYKFNPPDDARKTDLVHSCIVHEDPHIYCKPGDPLPILYLIDSPGIREKVYSMPYPYPIAHVRSAEIVDVSSP